MNYLSKWKKKKSHRSKVEQFVEPTRRSLFDLVSENFKCNSRFTYVHRIIYIGEHFFKNDTNNTVATEFRNNVNYVNSFYCDELLTGFLLYYSKFFCHVLEGSEEAIKKHLHLLLNNSETLAHLGRLKLLVVTHHINQRFLNVWTEIGTKPPSLLEKIDPNSDLETTHAKLLQCVSKLYKLGLKLRVSNNEIEPQNSLCHRSMTLDDHEDEPQYSTHKNIIKVISTISNYEGLGRPIYALPESQLLEFLIQSNNVQDLQTYADAYGSVAIIKIYTELAWPAITDFMPRNVFDTEFDPIVDLEDMEAERSKYLLQSAGDFNS